jgi:putative nucleotidyltransferase with HDIG domain
MSESSLSQIDDTDVTKVDKTFFADGLVLSVNVFLRIKPNGYLLVGRKGAVSTVFKLQAVSSGADLYVMRSDYSQVVAHNMNITEKVVNTKAIQPLQKVKYVQSMVSDVMNEMFSFGVGAGSFENMKKISSFVSDVATNIEDLGDLFKALEGVPGQIPRHSTATAMMSLMIAEEMGITQKLTLEKLVLGGLLHDIGLKEVPRAILMKPRRSWTEEELLQYESHPRRGVEMMAGAPNVPDDVMSIIVEHHENSQGTGYPRQLRDLKMNPLARIVALADAVTDAMYGTTEKIETTKSFDEVVTHIQTNLGQPFHKPAFLALKNLANKQHMLKKKKEA